MRAFLYSLVTLLCVACGQQDQPPKPFLALDGTQAQVFRDSQLTLTANTPTLVNLWASWCAPCRKELPFLQQLQQNGDITVRLINIDDTPEDAEKVLSEIGITDLTTEYATFEQLDELGIQGLPASLLIDRKTLYLGVGVLQDEEIISHWLSSLNH